MAAAPGVNLQGLEGSIAVPQPAMASVTSSMQTLDEPVMTTLLRDVRKIGIKLRYVLVPSGSESEALKELRNWDLWGPLLLCLVLSM